MALGVGRGAKSEGEKLGVKGAFAPLGVCALASVHQQASG